MQGDKCYEEPQSGSLWEPVRMPDPGRTDERPGDSVLGKILKGVAVEWNPNG